MGELVTVELAADSPQHDLPWIVTFGPLDEDEDWDPVVCGPYERPHAIALAQHVVADGEWLAVVEPLLPATSAEEIRELIQQSKDSALTAAEENDDDMDSDVDIDEFVGEDEGHAVGDEPTPDEIRAGFARISAKLTNG